MTPLSPSASFTEMVQVVLPNDANPLGFMLGGSVMHLIDIAGAIACNRHTRTAMLTAAVDSVQFMHPIRIGDLIVLRATVTAAFTTSLEVEVQVYSEGALTGERTLTSVAYLTFVSVAADGRRLVVPPLQLDTPAEQAKAQAAATRREARLAAKTALRREMKS